MHAFVSATAFFLFTGSLFAPVYAQDAVGSKKFRIKFQVDEKTKMVEPVELWVTRDKGTTWVPSREAGVVVKWGDYSGGGIVASVVRLALRWGKTWEESLSDYSSK